MSESLDKKGFWTQVEVTVQAVRGIALAYKLITGQLLSASERKELEVNPIATELLTEDENDSLTQKKHAEKTPF